MRTSPLRSRWAAEGATFEERDGREIAVAVGDRRAEYDAVRQAVGLTDFSFVQTYRFPEEKGVDMLDGLLAGNVSRIRFGRVLHTFLADADGHVVGDCYVANNDQEFIVMCESILPDAEVNAILDRHGMAEAGGQELTGTHVMLGLDGVRAWEVARELFGPDVLGLPYLSLEVYPFEGESVYLLRGGKTGEFGYLILAPVAVADKLYDAVRPAVDRANGRCCGADVHQDLRLEGRFFNIHAEGRRVRDPLVLGLQWMIDFEKERFHGAEAIRQRRSEGLKRKIVGIAVDAGSPEPAAGETIFEGGGAVAEVVAHCTSHVLGHPIGLAVFPVALAYSGLEFRRGAADGPPVRTISMPPIMPASLKVKLDEK